MLYYLVSIVSFVIFIITRLVNQSLLFDPRTWGPTLQDLRASLNIRNAWLWVIGFGLLLIFSFIALAPVEFFVIYIVLLIFWIMVLIKKISNVLIKFCILLLSLYVLLHIVVGTYFFVEWPARKAEKFRTATEVYRDWAADVTDKED